MEQRTEAGPSPVAAQLGLGVAVAVAAGLLAWGATLVSSDAGYGGVGPNFLPWAVAVGLMVCGLLLAWEARTGGYRDLEAPSGAARGHLPGCAWVSVGILANAALITSIGFILSCALCFTLAVRGFKLAQGHGDTGPIGMVKDALIGAAIAAPVFWLFTQALAINLPGLTTNGWI
jgi:putative tricarboxylic transport membrane protein